MTTSGFPADRLNRILTAVETIEESLGILSRKQRVSREDYNFSDAEPTPAYRRVTSPRD